MRSNGDEKEWLWTFVALTWPFLILGIILLTHMMY